MSGIQLTFGTVKSTPETTSKATSRARKVRAKPTPKKTPIVTLTKETLSETVTVEKTLSKKVCKTAVDSKLSVTQQCIEKFFHRGNKAEATITVNQEPSTVITYDAIVEPKPKKFEDFDGIPVVSMYLHRSKKCFSKGVMTCEVDYKIANDIYCRPKMDKTWGEIIARIKVQTNNSRDRNEIISICEKQRGKIVDALIDHRCYQESSREFNANLDEMKFIFMKTMVRNAAKFDFPVNDPTSVKFDGDTSQTKFKDCYMYLVQFNRFVLTGESIYKLGTSAPDSLYLRLGKYEKGSDIIGYVKFRVPKQTAEGAAKTLFKKHFTQMNTHIGQETFKGNVNKMLQIYLALIEQLMTNPEDEMPVHEYLGLDEDWWITPVDVKHVRTNVYIKNLPEDVQIALKIAFNVWTDFGNDWADRFYEHVQPELDPDRVLRKTITDKARGFYKSVCKASKSIGSDDDIVFFEDTKE